MALTGSMGMAFVGGIPTGGWSGTDKAVAAGANDFAFRLSAELAEMVDDGNLICSPYSVWIPLAALVNATNEEYRDALLDALGVAGVTADEINAAASLMMDGLIKESKTTLAELLGIKSAPTNALKIANAIFVSSEVTLKKEFADIFTGFYHGTAANVDFSSHEAVDTVNQWASDNTEGLIKRIIESFSPDAIIAITNAIYFTGQWEKEFNPNNTKEDIFHAPGGDTTAFYMPRRGGNLDYYEDSRVQAMPLAFAEGGGLCVILPKDESAVEMLAAMTSEYFNAIMEGATPAEGLLLLPKFTIEGDTMNLKNVLEALGVPLFDKKAAPLTGGLVEEAYDMWVSGVFHKAVIEVDEKGTTAAAATIVVVDYAMAMPPGFGPEPFEMICDKPFVFIVYGETDGDSPQVLFTGIVNKP